MNKVKLINYLVIIFIGVLQIFISEPGFAVTYEGTINGNDGAEVSDLIAAPTNLTVTQSGTSAASLSWNAVTGADSYKIYRMKSGESWGVLVTQTGAGYLDTLSNGTYSYKIKAVLNGVESTDFSNTVSITISTGSSGSSSGGSSSGGGGGGGGSYTPLVTTTTTGLSDAAKQVDSNNDNKIDVLDFNTLMINWGSGETGNNADFDNNGKVDVFDFNLLMINWVS